MKQIKYRIRDNGKWYYGLPFGKNIDKEICGFESFDGDYYNVFADRSTLCQFIGKQDNNGVDIYEGDIVKVDYIEKRKNIFTNKTEDYEFELIEQVVFEERLCAFCLKVMIDDIELFRYIDHLVHNNQRITCITIIGNKFDNPDFLKE